MTFIFPFSSFLSASLASEVIRGSSTSKEANADGNARVRVAPGKNIGDDGGGVGLSSVTTGTCLGFSCAFLIFIASFDRFVSAGETGVATWRSGESGAEEVDMGLAGDVRL